MGFDKNFQGNANFDSYSTDYSNQTSKNLLDNNVLSVTEYLIAAQQKLNSLRVTIQGEISKLNTYGTSVYITLSDKQTRDVMKCWMSTNILSSLDLPLTVGLEIRITGKPWIMKRNGELQFAINHISPVGEGALYAAYIARKKRLEAAGYFDQYRKKKIPQFITRIGLLTAKGADGNIDFVQQLGNYGFKIYFLPSRVDGFPAMESIINGINYFNCSNLDLDVIVITRGGGGFESLQAYDTEEMALAIHASRIPVITAIGHRSNVTIAQLAADAYANTPTHAAEMIRSSWEEAITEIQTISANLTSRMRQQIINYRHELNNYWQNYKDCFEIKLRENGELINNYGKSLIYSFDKVISAMKSEQRDFRYNFNSFIAQINTYKRTLQHFNETAERNIGVILNILIFYRNTLKNSRSNIGDSAYYWLNNLKRILMEQKQSLDLANPLRRLEQGYSIVYNNTGKVIKSTHELAEEELVSIRLYKGRFQSVVKKVQE